MAFSLPQECERRLRDIRARWCQALKAAPNLAVHVHDPIQRRFTSKEANHMDDLPPQSGSGLALEKSDLRPLWQYFEQRGSEVKSTMLTVVALLIGFAAALLGYGVDKAIALDPGPTVTQPALLLAVAAAGIAVVAYAEVVIRDFGEHINRNFARADTVRLKQPAILDQVLVASEADRP